MPLPLKCILSMYLRVLLNVCNYFKVMKQKSKHYVVFM